MKKISPKKLCISIYTVIDLLLLTLFFILILPFLVDLCSILFVKKSFNLFAFATIFPLFFNYIANANQWINGAILAVCLFYIVCLFYFNIHFGKIVFNREKWLFEVSVILLFETLGTIIILIMILWSSLKMVYYLNIIKPSLVLIILTLIPGIDVFTLFYWVPMFVVKGWSVVLLGLYLIWFIVATIVIVIGTYTCITCYWLEIDVTTGKKWGTYSPIDESQEDSIDFDLEENKLIKCQTCDIGLLELKNEEQTMVVKCNNLEQCHYVVPLEEFIFKFFQQNGIRIYKWEKQCWKCQKVINIYAYFPSYQLKQVLNNFNFHFGGPGLFPTLDEYLKSNYQTISDYFSKKFNKTFVVNNCIYCNVSQGKYLTVENPYEILDDMKKNKLDEKYLDKIIDFNTCPLSESEVANCFAFLKENFLKS